MRVAEIRALFDYNAWANNRLLTTAAAIPTAAFIAPTRFPRGSLRDTLLHLLNAGRFHLSQWEGGPSRPDLAADAFPDLATLTQQWTQDEAELRGYLATLTDADLDQPRTITFAYNSTSVTAPLWLLMNHVIHHATQHRGEIAQMLTELGHSPGDFDLIDMLPATPIA